jgi:hypothetical protein
MSVITTLITTATTVAGGYGGYKAVDHFVEDAGLLYKAGGVALGAAAGYYAGSMIGDLLASGNAAPVMSIAAAPVAAMGAIPTVI